MAPILSALGLFLNVLRLPRRCLAEPARLNLVKYTGYLILPISETWP
jgi:hypothetical protein